MNYILITEQCQGCRLVTFWQVSNCNILVFQHHSMKTDKPIDHVKEIQID